MVTFLPHIDVSQMNVKFYKNALIDDLHILFNLQYYIFKIIWSLYFLNVQDQKRYQEGTNAAGVKLRYYGDLVDGNKEGTGQTSWEDGQFYSGEFKNDCPHGKGIYIWPNGDVYDGEYENGKKNGMGVSFNIRKKWRYEGQFKDDKPHGSGIWHNEDGDFYIGGFENNNFHGFGSLNSADGQTVIKCGLWENGELKKQFWTQFACFGIKLIDWKNIDCICLWALKRIKKIDLSFFYYFRCIIS